jgi:hypothetical protein
LPLPLPPPPPSSSSSPSPPSLTSCIFITHTSRKLARAARGSKGKKNKKKKREKCMHEKGSRVTDTICLVVEKRRLNVKPIFSPHIRYEKHASLKCRRARREGGRRECSPYSTMSRSLIEIMSSGTFARISSHFIAQEHPTIFPLQLLDGVRNN